MIPLAKELETWLRHKAGIEAIPRDAVMANSLCSVELNEDAKQIFTSFGNREFDAIVGFIDMRGFSASAKGKSPKEIHSLVKPFLDVVIEVARKHGCFIDKTIGDEVMIVMPWFEYDSLVASSPIPPRKLHVFEVGDLVHDLILGIGETAPSIRFSAGFALGSLLLEQVGTASYSEWTVYGNCVNAAKRLQSLDARPEWADAHVVAMGQIESELEHFQFQLQSWKDFYPQELARRSGIFLDKKEFKGVGSIVFAHAAFEAATEAA